MKSKKYFLRTALLVAGIMVSYIQQMAPSPLLAEIRDAYALSSDALLNLSVSIIFPVIIAASFTGGTIERRAGLNALYAAALAALAAGVLLNFAAGSYAVFLAGRAVFGAGFGLGIPLMGSAITSWFPPERRPALNTLNSLYPFVGTLVSFVTMAPLTERLNGDFRRALGIWGVPLLLVLLWWCAVFLRRERPERGENGGGGGLYFVLGKREIRLVAGMFVCDFACYSYVSVILPTMLFEAAGGAMAAARANLLAAIIFPAVGMLGCAAGGVAAASGRQKFALASGQLIKFAGLLAAAAGCRAGNIPATAAGFAFFGFGNGFWMPAMYGVPMALDGMTPALVGTAFAFISSCGFAAGFAAPALGGLMTDMLAGSAGHLAAMRISLEIFNLANLAALFLALKIYKSRRASG